MELEEAPESYKDIEQVIEACHNSGISKRVVRLVHMEVIKG
jgi:tRNA-splicing ligase RtcB